MKVLQFLGRDAESDALLFTDAEGTQYASPLTDALSDAVIRGISPGTPERALVPLSPREIQALLREGVSPAQIAEQSGTDIERILRFQGPVNAEIQRAISRVRNSRVGTEMGSPTLGDLVIDRLAQRDVETDALDWRAVRRGDGSWEVSAIFIADNVEQTASWSLSEATNLAIAKDSNAKDLTEVRHPAEPVRALFPPVVSAGRSPEPADSDSVLERQEQLLSRLNSQRGRRQPVLIDFETEDDDSDITHVGAPKEPVQFKGEGPPALASVSVPPSPNTDGAVRPALKDTRAVEEDVETTVLSPSALDASRKRRRTPVPSWDEIVFGSRPE